MKDKLATISALYPDKTEVWETSDGLLHLTSEEAEVQAKHLPSVKIKAHSLTPKKGKHTT